MKVQMKVLRDLPKAKKGKIISIPSTEANRLALLGFAEFYNEEATPKRKYCRKDMQAED